MTLLTSRKEPPVPAEIDVTECPDCGQTGRYDARVKIGGRGIYTCPALHRWQDADERPDTKGYVQVPMTSTGPDAIPGPPSPPRPVDDRPYA